MDLIPDYYLKLIKLNKMMKTKQLLTILAIFMSLAGNAQFFGINYTPGRDGVGVSLGNDKFMIGFEKGTYKASIDGYTEYLHLSKITAHISIYKYEFKDGGYTITYAGFGYNEFKGETDVLLDKDNLYKLSFEAGGIVKIGAVNPMILFDFVNWEGKLGLMINFEL